MLGELNKIRNADFSAGGRLPRAWTWISRERGVTWSPAPGAQNGDLAGVHLHSTNAAASGMWSQSFRVRKDQHYRVEAVVSCDCAVDAADGGLVLALHRADANGRRQAAIETPPLRQAHEHVIRTYLQPSAKVQRIELRVGLRKAQGFAAVHDVRVIPIIEPEAKSHPWAIPPLPCAAPAPVRVQRVCVVTRTPDRPVVRQLRAVFGEGAIQTCTTRGFRASIRGADAVLLLDDKPPPDCRTLAALKTLARKRIVVVALECMEAIAKGQLATRLVEQVDDPLHARVRYANFVTAGFALHDIIPFAEIADRSTRMTQRQFRTSGVFRDFCAKHGFEVLLESETDADSTSEKPIALVHQGTDGAIVVMDVAPLEAVDSTLGEPALAAHLVFNALGATRGALGQYIAPARATLEFLHQVRDLVERFDGLTRTNDTQPLDPEQPCLITLGRELESVGLPLAPRPVLFIRTGLWGDDILGAYGVMLWLKQLLRPAPFLSPYANTLAARFRVMWMPLAAPLGTWGGWRATTKPYPVDIDFSPGTVAACLDITSCAQHSVKLVTHECGAFGKLLADCVPNLADQLIAGRHIYRAVPAGQVRAVPTTATWRRDDLRVHVTHDGDAFREPFHRAAANAGAKLLRLELPATHTEPLADSIWQTEWAAQMTELLAGLLLGLVVVNRGADDIEFDWPAPRAELHSRAALRRINAPAEDIPLPPAQTRRVTLPGAHAIVTEL